MHLFLTCTVQQPHHMDAVYHTKAVCGIRPDRRCLCGLCVSRWYLLCQQGLWWRVVQRTIMENSTGHGFYLVCVCVCVCDDRVAIV